MRRLCTLVVIDDEIKNREETCNSETTPNRDVPTTPESVVKTPELSDGQQQDCLVDEFRTPCNNTSKDHVTETEDLTHNVTAIVTSDTKSDTATEMLKWTQQEEEMDDFDYLGTLDDNYLLSLFSEEEEKEHQTGSAEVSGAQKTSRFGKL